MAELSNVELNIKEVINIVVKNIGLMFHRRNYMKSKSFTDKIIEHLNADKLYNFEIEHNNKNTKYSINIINQDVKNISNGSPIDDYLNKNIDAHKFLIVKSFSKKTYSQIIKDYKNVEIFTLFEFLEDIPAKEFIPQHILLNDEEKKELFESFGLNELGRIYSTDIMARYYGAKLNDVFRIIRHNLNSGTSIYYRFVVPGNMDIFI
jgi:DNA-directed RNA polymerase subunit H (RpoH/RPB5)